ncbi:MAG: hypothetical protein O3C49_07885 [Proteobacteria bacterium]|nr:hypothetical protein [Pseudomonadota bacterium]MDA1326300.1 hypothetical protein [Pseudomonadota bacterium]
MKFGLAAIAGLAALSAAAALPSPSLAGPIHDPNRLLSQKSSDTVLQAAAVFAELTGRRMLVIVLPKGRVPDFSTLESLASVPSVWKSPQANIGIVFASSPDDTAGRLLIVDPVWRKVLPAQWNFMFPQRLAQKFGDEPFERRVVLSAQYLATVFPDKLAFVLKPRGGKLDDASLKFSRGSYIGLEILGYFIVIFTAFRTFWPARLRDEDQDDFSNELRRLKKERQIW